MKLIYTTEDFIFEGSKDDLKCDTCGKTIAKQELTDEQKKTFTAYKKAGKKWKTDCYVCQKKGGLNPYGDYK